MTAMESMALDLDRKTELVVFGAGTALAVAAAYLAGATGNWVPLLVTGSVLSLLALVTS